MCIRDSSYLEQPPKGHSPSKLAAHQNRNILFTCLGSPAKPVFDMAGPVPLQQGDKILLCSDGLWGTLSDDEIVQKIGQGAVGEAVPQMVEMALQRAGATSDNVTAIALEWETPDDFESTRNEDTSDQMHDGVYASTVQSGGLESGEDDLDDAAIERSIAEINEAIRRSAARRR